MKINNLSQNSPKFGALYTNLDVVSKSQKKIVDLLAVNDRLIPNDLISKLAKQNIDIFVNPNKTGATCIEALKDGKQILRDSNGELVKTAVYSNSSDSINVIKDFVKQCRSLVK